MKKVAIIPIAILLLILLAFATTNAYRVPTADFSFVEERPARVETVVFEVAGLKCRGMATLFAEQIGALPGVLSFTAYSRTNSAVVEYDPTLTHPDAIREAFEAPIEHEGETYEAFKWVSQEHR
jgi:hypothetical protein